MSGWMFTAVMLRWGVVVALAMVLTGSAQAAPKKPLPPRPVCDRCKDLPMLEKQLNQQEWLRAHFKEYVDWKVPTRPKDYKGKDKTPTEYMVDTVTAAFNEYLHTPAGGGGGKGQAELGTDFDNCKLVYYVKDKEGNNVKGPDGKAKTLPFDEDEYNSKNCKPLADFVLAHEKQHVADCNSEHKDVSQWQNYAAYDVRGYAAGIKSLRATIAAIAKECHWQGSSRSTKRMEGPGGGEVDVVPTPDEIKKLAKAVKKKGGRK